MMITIHASQDSDKVLSIRQFGYEDNGKEAHWGPGQRNYYLIHFVVTGRGYFNGNPVGDNQGFLIRPNMHHEYAADTNNPWNYYWVILDGVGVEECLKKFHLDEATGIFTNTSHAKIHSFFMYIFSTNEGIVSADFAKSCFSMLLSYQDKHHEPFDNGSGNIISQHIEKAVQYCELNYCHPITISEVSEFVHLDNQYLYNIFKKHLHISPKAYLNNIRVTKAKQLLIETSLTVAEIANSVGYEDTFQFSKFFKKQTGSSPNMFKKEKQTKRL